MNSMRLAIAVTVMTVLLGRIASAQAALARECLANRATPVQERAGRARFVMDHPEPRFPVRSATLTRALTCSFRAGRLLHASEAWYLTLVSQDRDDPGFSTRAPGMSRRYYLVCEGRVGTTLGSFVAGQKLSFIDNSFTLPCGHMIYRSGSSDPAQAERVSGVYSYRVHSATWTVRRGPTPGRPTFDVVIDVVAINPLETLHLSGQVAGSITTSVRVFDCPPHQATKQAQPPGCN